MPFQNPKYSLQDLLKQVGDGLIQLPDFQREWKWDDDRITSLLASVMLDHPIGVLMMLETGGDSSNFAATPLSGSNAPKVKPQRLLLDGQQRMTSLFQALASN